MCDHPRSLRKNCKLDRFGNHFTTLTGYYKQEVESWLKMPYLITTRTCSITNKFLLPLYDLKKAEYAARHGEVKEEVMFYTTSAERAEQVARNNFDWRTETKNREYGNGVVFSPDPEYSNFLCKSRASVMAIIVVNVLMVKASRGNAFMDFPPGGCDTTCDKDGKVFVKFHDHEFLPTHVVFFLPSDVRLNRYYTRK